VRRYETTLITHPDLTEEDLEKITQKAVHVIQQRKGEMLQVQQWGKKRLAYKIKKQTRGGYTFLDYAAGGEAVRELERVCRLNDKVLKFLTVMIDVSVDPEAVRNSFAEARKPISAPEQESAAEAPLAPEAPAAAGADPADAAPEATPEEGEPS